MGVDAQAFKDALRRWVSGVTVVTIGGDSDHGMTASSFSSLSLDPPLILVCVKKGNATHGRLLEEDGFAINILGTDHKDLSNRFAGYPPMEDRFADLTFERAPVSKAPLLPGALASLDCTRHAVYDGGDHSIFVGKVEGISLQGDGTDLAPLMYYSGSYCTVGDRI